jgi:hypothetical protein
MRQIELSSFQHGLMVAIAVGLVAATAPASGQVPVADPAARATLTEAASALGMVRGLNRALDMVNMFEFTAHGTMAGPDGTQQQVTRITAGFDYVIPAARVEIEKMLPDGTTLPSIEVAAGALAWDESTPGVFLRPAGTPAAQRLKLIWLFPHGVILAGAKTLDKVKVTQRSGMNELSVTSPDGTEFKGLLDEKNLMTRVEARIGTEVFSADYADYQDFQGYGVMFPSRIVQKIDGRIVADLTVTEALANPYLIFPPPKELVQR